MKNYICIDGKKVELTPEQLVALGVKSITLLRLADLLAATRQGRARDTFKVHDVIEDFGHQFEIIGFDHDKNAEHPERSTVTVMARDLLPERRMHKGSCPGGWKDTELRKYLNEDFFGSLPIELKAMIQPTSRKSNDSKGNIHVTTDLLFLPTESELFGSAICSACECGVRYEAFATSADRCRFDENGDARWYWTSSANAGSSTAFVAVASYGYVSSSNASNAARAPFCFQLS